MQLVIKYDYLTNNLGSGPNQNLENVTKTLNLYHESWKFACFLLKLFTLYLLVGLFNMYIRDSSLVLVFVFGPMGVYDAVSDLMHN